MDLQNAGPSVEAVGGLLQLCCWLLKYPDSFEAYLSGHADVCRDDWEDRQGRVRRFCGGKSQLSVTGQMLISIETVCNPGTLRSAPDAGACVAFSMVGSRFLWFLICG